VVVELRMKEELLSKKVAALEGLVTSKDEEIRFLNNKLAQSEEQLKDYQKKSEANLNLLKEKISFVLELYQDL
jgi:predicted  nucleic acid-binding Zn-ribbon protein